MTMTEHDRDADLMRLIGLCEVCDSRQADRLRDPPREQRRAWGKLNWGRDLMRYAWAEKTGLLTVDEIREFEALDNLKHRMVSRLMTDLAAHRGANP